MARCAYSDRPVVIDVVTGDDADHTYKSVVSRIVGARQAATTLAPG